MFLEPFLHMNNRHRPRRGINGHSPISVHDKENYDLPASQKGAKIGLYNALFD